MPPLMLRRLALVCVLAVAAAVFLTGIHWGLPSHDVDPYLFGGEPAWSGAKVMQLAGERSDDPRLGVDVSRHRLTRRDQLLVLNDTDADRAEIIRRYRLYTAQPDEVSVLMAIGRMRPGKLDFDPRYYQYGGFYLYPVAAMLKAAGTLHYLFITPDPAYYIDHPEAFARFYVVARLWSVAWGVVGAWAVFWIARRFAGGLWVPAIAGVAYAFLPVVVNQAHEAKPHLQGAVLMLLAAMAACRYVETGKRPVAWLAGALCGTAFGSVLTALYAFAVLPVMVALRPGPRPLSRYSGGGSGRGPTGIIATENGEHAMENGEWNSSFSVPGSPFSIDPVAEEPPPRPSPGVPGEGGMRFVSRMVRSQRLRVLVASATMGVIVYLATNPYVAINLVRNRDVLRSNLGNTGEMYRVGGWGAGVPRAIALIAEGASPGIAVAGAFAVVVAIVRGVRGWRRDRATSAPPGGRFALGCLLAAPFACVMAQYVSLAAGKPGEYGRFAIYVDVVLLLAAVCGPAAWVRRRAAAFGIVTLLLVSTVVFGKAYLDRFARDAAGGATRWEAAQQIKALSARGPTTIAIWVEPAPYSVPPVNLLRDRLVLLPRGYDPPPGTMPADVLVRVVDDPRAPEEPWLDAYARRAFSHGIPAKISWADKPFVVYAAPTPER